MVFGQGIGNNQKRALVGIALQALLEPRFAVLLDDAPADLPEQGVAHQRRAEGGFGLDNQSVCLHNVISQKVGWRQSMS